MSLTSAGIVFAGIGRNVRRTVPYVLKNLERYGRLFAHHQIVVVENDSVDGTREFLSAWAKERPSRVHIGSDKSQTEHMHHTARLAAFRNYYMQHIDSTDDSRFQYLAVFDCDHVNVRPIEI